MSGFTLGAESTLDQPAPAAQDYAVDATPVDRPMLSGDPAAWMANQRALREAAPKPPEEHPEFEHGPACRSLGDPSWELREDDVRAGWVRKCGACQQMQIWVPPRPPEPPRPSDEVIAAWRHSHDGRQCPVEAVELTIVRDAGGLAIWRADCLISKCGARRWFGAESADHYRGLGIDLRVDWQQVRGFELGGSGS